MLARFVPAADEVGRLQRDSDAEARLFQGVAALGHYAARAGSTRQGIYAMTPSGKLLGSWNSRQVREVQRQLRAALAAWDALPEAERYPTEALAAGPRFEDRYPEDGLALLATSRDLPRTPETRDPADWRTHAWNVDHLWFTAAEARALAEGRLPEPAAIRLVRLHTRDNVRGQTRPFPRDGVRVARLEARVVAVDGATRTLELTGAAHVEETGEWHTDDDRSDPGPEHRAFRGDFYGTATFDGTRSTAFELALVGSRNGATQYNERHDDRGPAPMGVVFQLAPPGDRVAPSMHYEYGREYGQERGR